LALILLYARLLLQHLLAGPFRPQPAGGAGCQIVTDIGNQGKPDILLHEPARAADRPASEVPSIASGPTIAGAGKR